MSKPLRTILAPADPRYGTAVHESAHAVLARLFSLNIEGIDLIVRPSDGGTSHGQFRWAPAPEEGYPLTDLELNEACIRVVMAGPIAKEMAGHDGRAGIDGDQANHPKISSAPLLGLFRYAYGLRNLELYGTADFRLRCVPFRL